ncbi:MAG: T9SS type A sorting domain-containing protein [Tannerellaceae bacterium]|jgi:hypothetical protein|nr:T9SS type A sorting domain-containing protein [Tannerellaceae bacterium]
MDYIGKTFNTKIACLILLVFFTVKQATGQTHFYVSPTAIATSGTGSAATPRALTANIFSGYSGTAVLHMTGGTYSLNTSITVPAALTNLEVTRTTAADKPVIDGRNSSGLFLSQLSYGSATASVNFNHLTFRNFKGSGSSGLIVSMGGATANTNCSVIFDYVIIEGAIANNIRGEGYLLGFNATGTSKKRMDVKHTTIRNCRVNRIFRTDGASESQMTISHCSVYNNHTGLYLVRLEGLRGTGGLNFFNNTFSNNTTQERYIYMACQVQNIANNTFYQSGEVNLAGNISGRVRTVFINNIAVNRMPANGLRGLPTVGSDIYLYRNIINVENNIFYCDAGNSPSDDLTNTFAYIFETGITVSNPDPGKQYHALQNMQLNYWNISRGVNVASYGFSFTDDQVESARQTPFTLGAYDRHLELKHVPVSIFITPDMTPKNVDLSLYIANMPGTGSLSYTPPTASGPRGSMTLNGSTGLASLTPNYGGGSGFQYFNYQVGQSPAYTATGSIGLRLTTAAAFDVPGMENLANYNTCYDYMGSIEFTSEYRYMTSYKGLVDPLTGLDSITSPPLSPNTNHLYGYAPSYVADLDGDGYPEIIALGRRNYPFPSGSAEAYRARIRYLYIYDGQTGRQLAKFNLDMKDGKSESYNEGWHLSPGTLAIVDADRDGNKEALIAFPYEVAANETNSTYPDNAVTEAIQYRTRLMSYVLKKLSAPVTAPIRNSTKQDEVHHATPQYPCHYSISLNPKWTNNASAPVPNDFPRFTARYRNGGQNNSADPGNAANANINNLIDVPLVQIADIEGDGEAEVYVLNKVYSAVDGRLKFELEDMGTGTLGTGIVPNFGTDRHIAAADPANYGYNGYIPLAYIYDIDLDGRYEIIAGGKIYYDLDTAKSATASSNMRYKILSMAGVPDARTGVADINGDGIPDVVTIRRINSPSDLRITVWDPGFLMRDANGNVVPKYAPNAITGYNDNAPSTFTPTIIADITVPLKKPADGTNSYVFIGDIDGREQIIMEGGVAKSYRLPEIAILGGNYSYNTNIHPNVSGIAAADGGLKTSGSTSSSSHTASGTAVQGALAAFTWDASATTPATMLKLSFLMEHIDFSGNTGFTMFDFDNDGINEICYRDERSLRIIKPIKPFIGINEDETNSNGAIIFRRPVASRTGFEYPVIADIDRDASAEMLTISYNRYMYANVERNLNQAMGWVFAVGNGSGDKFAPAWPVWNQYMYDPFKIDPFTIQTPIGKAPNRLDPSFYFTREIRDSIGNVVEVIDNYNPFNGTLIQATRIDSAAFPNYEPIVFLTEAYIWPNSDLNYMPKMRTVGANHFIEIRIGNKSTAEAAISGQTPIAVYKNSAITHENRIISKPLAAMYPPNAVIGTTLPLGNSFIVRPGVDTTIWIQVTDPYDAYIVRLGDDSKIIDGQPVWRFGYNGGKYGTTFSCPEFAQGLGESAKAFRDCDWCDQTVRAGRFDSHNDYYTVQEFNTISLDVLGNDMLPNYNTPSTPYFLNNLTLSASHISKQPTSGFLTFNGVAGAGSRIIYHHDDRAPLAANIDSFRYVLSYYDPSLTIPAIVDDTATVYIFILKSAAGGFSGCYGATTTITLPNIPVGVTFKWYDDETWPDSIQLDGRTRITGEMYADSIYWLKPITTNITTTPGVTAADLAKYKAMSFPRGKLTVALVTNTPTTTVKMRWTGIANNKWHDPRNWIMQRTEGGKLYESPVNFIPAACTDVVIPADVNNFPELSDPAICNDIEIKDRAMFKNPHMLTYNNAKVEIKLKPTELDRFLMWSAPLASMYSGDYHYRNTSGIWFGDSFMNFFQHSNPDNASTAALNTFTATIANVGVQLPLGQAFNLKVTSTSFTRDSLLRFPRDYSSYATPTNPNVPTPRSADSHKFITHGTSLSGGGGRTFPMTVYGDRPNGAANRLIQIVNPYMAYLSIDSFVTNNTAFQSGYYIWNGEVGADITANALDANNRLVVNNPNGLNFTPDGKPMSRYIPPLQSFFVAKTNTNASIPTVNMSPYWTTTAPVSSYALRASEHVKAGGVLYLKLTKGTLSAHAALMHTPGASDFASDKHDMPMVTYNIDGDMPISLYTLSADNVPLVINSSKFGMSVVNIAMILKDAGDYVLDFSGMHSFGYDVVLTDKQQGYKQTDIGKNSSYAFSVARPAGHSGAIYLYDRFTLRFTYTGAGIDYTPTETAPATDLYVSDTGESLLVRSTNGPIALLQVFNTAGALIYDNPNVRDSKISIRKPSGGAYIVKAIVNGESKIEKIIVK